MDSTWANVTDAAIAVSRILSGGLRAKQGTAPRATSGSTRRLLDELEMADPWPVAGDHHPGHVLTGVQMREIFLLCATSGSTRRFLDELEMADPWPVAGDHHAFLLYSSSVSNKFACLGSYMHDNSFSFHRSVHVRRLVEHHLE